MLKTFLLVVAALLLSVQGAKTLTPKSSEEVIDQLEGNNFNVYMIYFYQSSTTDKTSVTLKDELNKLLTQSPYDKSDNLVYMKVDESDKRFQRLGAIVGITVTPSVLVMVNGKGMWFSGANVPLLVERLREFLPDFLQASSQRTVPSYAGYQ